MPFTKLLKSQSVWKTNLRHIKIYSESLLHLLPTVFTMPLNVLEKAGLHKAKMQIIY